MNDMSATTESPGSLLRQAREKAGLNLAVTAEQLHLRPSVVEAMERDKYEEFPSAVFLKGYFRSYCRLLKLDEAQMLALLEARTETHFGEREAQRYSQLEAKQRVRRNLVLKKIALYGFILGIIVAIAVSYLAQPPDQETWSQPAAEQPPAAGSQLLTENQASTRAEPQEEPQEMALLQDTDAGDAEAAAEPSEVSVLSDSPNRADALEADGVQPVTPALVLDPEREAEPPRAAIASGDTGATNEHAATTSLLALNFQGDCWLKVTNGAGKVVEAALKRAGQSFESAGPAPFDLVLGNARVAKLVFRGQEIDLTPHTASNGRAALRLE